MDMSSLLPDFQNLALTIVAFIAALSVIVAVHEYGHYLIGRLSGIKADVFSIGMGPVLVSRVDRHGTRWQIAAFPVGGYVKFRGDANAASAGADQEAMDGLTSEELRETMHGAPLWARAATVAAGPIFNFIFSLILFMGMALYTGQSKEPLTVAKVLFADRVQDGLAVGDQILGINQQRFSDLKGFNELVVDLPSTPLVRYEVNRDGRVIEVNDIHPFAPIVGAVHPKSAAIAAGMLKGDLIAKLDGKPLATFSELRDVVVNGVGDPLSLVILRAGEEIDVNLKPRRQDLPVEGGGFETRWLIGINAGMAFEPARTRLGVWQSFTTGVDQVSYLITGSLSGIWHMITGKISSCNLSGPVGIAQVSGQAASQGGFSFIAFIAMMSTAIGLLNLFPIPVLDGGHLMFHMWEAVSGKPPSDRALNALLTLGMVIVLSLMVFGLGNDLFC